MVKPLPLPGWAEFSKVEDQHPRRHWPHQDIPPGRDKSFSFAKTPWKKAALKQHKEYKNTRPQKSPWLPGVPLYCSPTAVWHWKPASDVQEFILHVIMRWLEWLTAIKTSRTIQVQFINVNLIIPSDDLSLYWNRLTHWLTSWLFFTTPLPLMIPVKFHFQLGHVVWLRITQKSMPFLGARRGAWNDPIQLCELAANCYSASQLQQIVCPCSILRVIFTEIFR